MFLRGIWTPDIFCLRNVPHGMNPKKQRVGSAQLHKRSTRDSVSSQVDSVVPSSSNSAALRPESSRKCRFAALIRNKYAECKLSRLQSRRKNRPAISRDTQRAFRELISSWSCSELAAFCTEMDSAYAVRELVLMTEAARPPVSSLQQDLFNAFSNSIATDCFVLYRDGRYAAHEAILCARSRYFAEQFASVHHDVNDCVGNILSYPI
ncbi:unnamed protein product [Anisakis simplex]|uniref:BTB domain-containing protein n=1 Tax=Anisakis simplex TaxID=6269 RepID=A0A0M3J4Y1_ANISI|nr:unnamed protein product [Anisakis simplex]